MKLLFKKSAVFLYNIIFMPFFLIKTLIIRLEDRGIFPDFVFFMKMLFAPEILCDVEGWKKLRIFYRLSCYVFFFILAHLMSSYIDIPFTFFSESISIFSISLEKILFFSSMLLYAYLYQAIEYFMPKLIFYHHNEDETSDQYDFYVKEEERYTKDKIRKKNVALYGKFSLLIFNSDADSANTKDGYKIKNSVFFDNAICKDASDAADPANNSCDSDEEILVSF